MKKFLLFILIIFTFLGKQLLASNVEIGLLIDLEKKNDLTDLLIPILKNEIQKTVGREHKVIMSESNILYSNWDDKIAIENYNALTSRCDIILIAGSVSISSVAKMDNLKKPTIVLGIFDPVLQNVPLTSQNTSGKQNFSYILTAKDVKNEIQLFHDLTKFKKLAIVGDYNVIRTITNFKGIELVKALEKELNIEVVPALIHSDFEESAKQLPDDIDAAYLVITYETKDNRIKKIADYFIEQKIPTFSITDQFVDEGIMASFSTDNGFEQVIRKISIMIDGVLAGEKLADMNVQLNNKEELYINLNTAQKVGFSPPYKILFTTKMKRDNVFNESNTFSIEEILAKGLEQNLDIQINEKDYIISGYEFKTALSQYLPTADLSMTDIWLDEHRTSSLTGSAEKTISGSASLQQVVYSDQLFANIRIQRLLEKAQKYSNMYDLQNIVVDINTTYFNVLQAKTQVAILRENLELTKKNLSLSKLRLNIGSSSNADVYRWESELANVSQSLIEANSSLIMAKLQLNNLLNNALPEQFDIKDVSIDDDVFVQFSSTNLGKFVNTPKDLNFVVKFLVYEALKIHPAKKQLLANMDVVDRQISMYRRTYYLPTVALQAERGQVFSRDGKGSEPAPGYKFYDDSWNVALNLSFPIFDGNRRMINYQKAKVQQQQLQLQMENLDNKLELGIKSLAMQTLVANTNIEFAEISSTAASKSLEMVQNAYEKGATSVTDLLNAQQAALSAKLAHSNSVYNYLLSFLQLEASIGYIHQIANEEEQQKFRNHLMQFIDVNTKNK